jgi:hypothetical protein
MCDDGGIVKSFRAVQLSDSLRRLSAMIRATSTDQAVTDLIEGAVDGREADCALL